MSKRLTRMLLFALALAALVFVLNSDAILFRNPVTRAVVGVVTAPARLAEEAEGAVSEGWVRYVGLRDAREELEAIKEEMKAQQILMGRMEALEAENKRLRALLDYSRERSFAHVTARVFSADISPFFERRLVDRGAADGLRSGMPVLTHEGIVGRLGRILGPNLAELIFITDPESRLEVFVGENRARGVLGGKGRPLLDAFYVDWDQPAQTGDRVITSGMVGPFPKGLLVGTVKRVSLTPGDLFQAIEVEPNVRFDRLEEVFILTSTEWIAPMDADLLLDRPEAPLAP